MGNSNNLNTNHKDSVPFSIGSQIGPYEIVARLGAGSTGVVYKARDHRLERFVAIKVLSNYLIEDPALVAQFKREGRVVGQISHPNVVQVFDVGIEHGRPYLVHEFVDGDTLRRRLSKQLPTKLVFDYAVQIADGLHAAHEKNVVHRDLKPENILVTKTGQIKIADFGLSSYQRPYTSSDDSSPTLGSQPDKLMGTPAYMAPEYIEFGEFDTRSDIFAAGVIYYEMLTGTSPFKRDNLYQTLLAITDQDPAPASECRPNLPAYLDRLIARCIAKIPSHRFQSASDLSYSIQDFLSNPHFNLDRKFRINTKPWLLTVAVLTVLVLAGLWRTSRRPTMPQAQRITWRRGFIHNAVFTPESQEIIYSAAWSNNPLQVFRTNGNLAGSARAFEDANADIFAVSDTGRALLGLDYHILRGHTGYGIAATRPLNAGDSRPISDRVIHGDLSKDGEVLVTIRQRGNLTTLEYPHGTPVLSTPGWYSRVRISPSGQQLAILDHPHLGDNRGTVRIIDTKGHTLASSEGWFGLTGLAWSDSGKEVLFTGGHSESELTVYPVYSLGVNGKTRLVYRVPARLRLLDINGDKALLTTEEFRVSLSVGRFDGASRLDRSWLDGTVVNQIFGQPPQLFFTEAIAGGGSNYSTFICPLESGEAQRLGPGWGAKISPDGNTALATLFGTPPKLLLYATGIGTTKVIPFPEFTKLEALSWLPDGLSILIAAQQSGELPSIYRLEMSTRAYHLVAEDAGHQRFGGFAVSPDGTWFASHDSKHVPRIWSTSTGESRPVQDAQPSDHIIRWSGDGKRLYVFDQQNVPTNIFAIDIVSGHRTLWHTIEPIDPTGIMSAVSIVISDDEKQYAVSFLRLSSVLYQMTGFK